MDNLNISIFTEDRGLAQIQECQPQPAYKFFPQWFKNLNKDEAAKNIKSIKDCPVFAEYLTQGFVIPMWCDTFIFAGDTSWRVDSSINTYKWSIHDDYQYMDFVPKQNKKQVVFKTHCPWYVKTPPGYSVYQKNLYYHFNDFNILPGTINTDYHHEINQQVVIEKNKEIFIPRGAPFVWYIPYKRDVKFNYQSRLTNDQDKLDLEKYRYDSRSKFSGSYIERKKKLDGTKKAN